MRNYFILLLFLIYSFTIAKPKTKRKYTREDSVIVLTDKNFEKAIKHYKSLLVVFYASWCGHCQEFLPTYTKASLILQKNIPKINLAKIEMSANKQTQSKYGINSYPTIKFFKEGVPYNYTGLNSEQGIVQWMRKNILPTISELFTLSDISNFKNTHEVSIIYFGNDETIKKILYDIAIEDSDNFYGQCDFATAYTSFNAKNNSIVLFKKYGEERTELSGKLSKSGIERFINKYSVNKLLYFNDRTAKIIWKEKNPGLFLFRDPSQPRSNLYEQLFLRLSEKLFDRIRVVVSGIFSLGERDLNGLTNVKPNELPCVRIYDPNKGINAYYLMKGDINEKNVMKFVEDWEKGKLQLELKSEDPIKVQKGKVFETVSKTYNKDVIENDLNVLVMYYSPYFDEYKTFISVYEEIADRAKEEKDKINLRVAMIDMSRNALSLSEKITSYPTLRLFVKGEKNKGIEYKGEKTVKDIMNFVYSNLGLDSNIELNKNLTLDEDL